MYGWYKLNVYVWCNLLIVCVCNNDLLCVCVNVNKFKWSMLLIMQFHLRLWYSVSLISFIQPVSIYLHNHCTMLPTAASVSSTPSTNPIRQPVNCCLSWHLSYSELHSSPVNSKSTQAASQWQSLPLRNSTA